VDGMSLMHSYRICYFFTFVTFCFSSSSPQWASLARLLNMGSVFVCTITQQAVLQTAVTCVLIQVGPLGKCGRVWLLLIKSWQGIGSIQER